MMTLTHTSPEDALVSFSSHQTARLARLKLDRNLSLMIRPQNSSILMICCTLTQMGSPEK